MSLHKMVGASQDRDGWRKIVNLSVAANIVPDDTDQPEENLQRWNEYGKSLFSEETPNSNGNSESTLNVSLNAEDADIEPEPLLGEVQSAIKDLKNRKCPGLDNVPGEIVRHSGNGGLKAIHYLCCKIWRTCQWPTEWKHQEFVMLHKNENVKE
ncbi:endonuclease-reverse transcriptase [Elysia marginata]|uniref:Endonuclease-reverse transcriptase n=1 Tax=Elysia marginata TaxID=1093978 RepID=A0AAV4G1J6_9GAST|nr:endonuclease-reverse transcriptase [Elysia marginata]